MDPKNPFNWSLGGLVKNWNRVALYAVSAVVVALLFALAAKAGVDSVVGIYWCAAFWALVGFDFYRTQVRENGESEVRVLNDPIAGRSFGLADRIIGYLFAAPFIAPAKLILAASGRR